MKKHPEALNYSWDGSQQTLKSTWGNAAVTLQLILLLHPAAKSMSECVWGGTFFFVCASSLPIKDLLRWSTHSYPLSQTLLNPQTACAKKTSSPVSCMLNSGRLIRHTKAHTWLSLRICMRYKNIAITCWSETSGVKWDDKVVLPLINKWALCLCWCASFLSYLQHDYCRVH